MKIVSLQAKNGRDKEFEASLQRLRGENADVSQELAEIRVCSTCKKHRFLFSLE